MTDLSSLGYWIAGDSGTLSPWESLGETLRAVDLPFRVVEKDGAPLVAIGGAVGVDGLRVLAHVPALPPGALGDSSFRSDHGLRYPYYAGAMANGIASEAMVEALGESGMLGFFGAAGLSPARIEQALARLSQSMGSKPYGFNLINSPNEPAWQERVADLYIQYGVRLVEASAYIMLSLPLIKYRVHGIHRDERGRVVAPNRVIAKLSRVEVASRFFAPPPEKMIRKLVEAGEITEEQAQMAQEIPVAQDVTVEADSGGHTDHRPAITVLPAMLALRDRMQQEFAYDCGLRVGLAGGVSTPAAAAGAFAMGADYIATGSINQSCVESGTSDLVRAMLCGAAQTDVDQAPAADMFEMGVTVQVLKKGTRFVQRGNKLYELYRACESLDAIPPADREKIEKEIFRAPLEEIWQQTQRFFEDRDPRQVEKAAQNPRHKMALVFRWYLGQSSHWANAGVADRQEDYQVWCGPAMGAFNEWAKGFCLEAPSERQVADVALNILHGAAALQRLHHLVIQGVPVSPSLRHIPPRRFIGASRQDEAAVHLV